MITINENFLKLSDNYLFSEIARRVNTFKRNNPDKQVISLGIGDVTQPLPKASVQAMVKAVEEWEGPIHSEDTALNMATSF